MTVYYFSYYIFYSGLCLGPLLVFTVCSSVMPVKQFEHSAYLAMTNMLLCLNMLPVLEFFTTFSYLFGKIRTTFNVFLIAVLCGAFPVGMTMFPDVLEDANEKSRHELHGFQVVLGFLFPPSVSFLSTYNVFRLYELCREQDDCEPENEYFTRLLQESQVFFLIVASFLHVIIWWILIQMMDIAEDRGNPYRLFQNVERGVRFYTVGVTMLVQISLAPLCFNPFIKVTVEERVESEMEEVEERFENEQVTLERKAVAGFLDAMHTANEVQRRIIAVRSLTKEFVVGSFLWKFLPCIEKKKTYTAVKDLTFGVYEKKIFGLVGHKGSGRTATIQMIMGRLTPTSGRVVVDGEDMMPKDPKAFDLIGYCPQSDALWDRVTVDEHLDLYATVNGVKPKHFKKQIRHIKKSLKLDELGREYATSLQSGKRRKVSYGLSLLGYPKVTVLDEPTKYMNMDDKKLVWESIRSHAVNQKGVLISTNSIEEAYNVCDRIGFMVHGTLRNIGDPHVLKETFGQTYLIEVIIEDAEYQREREHNKIAPNFDEIWSKVEKELKKVEGLVIHQMERLVYRCVFAFRYSKKKKGSTSLPELFQQLEQMVKEERIKDYTVTQTTLERAFLDLAKIQEEYEDTESYLQHKTTK